MSKDPIVVLAFKIRDVVVEGLQDLGPGCKTYLLEENMDPEEVLAQRHIWAADEHDPEDFPDATIMACLRKHPSILQTPEVREPLLAAIDALVSARTWAELLPYLALIEEKNGPGPTKVAP